MALRMQERMRELQTKWSDGGFAEPFQVRMESIPVTVMLVTLVAIKGSLIRSLGEVNVAARLESGADANGILMSYETYAHCQDLIKVEQREAIKMKGINRDIKIFSVLKRKNELENEVIMNGESFKKIKVENTASELLEKRLEKVEKELVLLAEELTKLVKNVVMDKQMVKITGKAMMSTIKIMETLGSVGKGILKDNKALKIKPDKTYPINEVGCV